MKKSDSIIVKFWEFPEARLPVGPPPPPFWLYCRPMDSHNPYIRLTNIGRYAEDGPLHTLQHFDSCTSISI